MSSRPVCIVTGGSSGIGLETARRFASEGYDVAVCARNEERLVAVEKELAETFSVDVLSQPVDLANSGAATEFVGAVAQRFNRIDVLVNNAGVAPNCTAEFFDQETFDLAMSVNVRAVFETVRAVWQPMKHAGRGVIVNVSSLAAVDPFPGFSVYGGTKAFVETFTLAIANEGKDDGIRSYCVRPGAVDTPLLKSLFPDFPADERLEPASIANLIFALTGDGMRYSSGEAITIRK